MKNKIGFSALKRAGINYGGIGSIEKLLDARSRDVDILVDSKNLGNAVAILIEGYQSEGWEFIKIIRNEYAVQLFFAWEGREGWSFIQWDVMPCLTWRGLSLIDSASILENCDEVSGVKVIQSGPIKVYKLIRGALVNSAEANRLHLDLEETILNGSEVPKWIRHCKPISRLSLRVRVYRCKLIKDFWAYLKFYWLNFLRLLNPPGVAVSCQQSDLLSWSSCHDFATKDQNAFPYLGVVRVPSEISSFRLRLRLIRELYLGRIVVYRANPKLGQSSFFFWSRSLNFLLTGRSDIDVRDKATSLTPKEIVTILVRESKKIFIRNEIS